MSILSYFQGLMEEHRSKHQAPRRGRTPDRRGMFAVIPHRRNNPAGTKLAKYFAKARSRSPRGY